MNSTSGITRLFSAPRLTRRRIAVAVAVAAATDLAQALSGPPGWLFFDEILDVIAMVVTTAALGFHPLLLPTFIIELIPVADWLPTWTGCTLMVITLRRRSEAAPAPPKPARVLGPDLLPPPLEIPGAQPPETPKIPKKA